MNDEKPEKPTLKQQIDSDEQLQKLGRRLSILSLLFLGVMLTGATIEEANTFVFKVKITTQEGIPALFFLSTLYLMFRYYTYARPYHKKIEEIWWARFSSDALYVHHSDEEIIGLVYDLDPGFAEEDFEAQPTVLHRGIFDRIIEYRYTYNPPNGEIFDLPDTVIAVSIGGSAGLRTYFSIYFKETKYQLRSYIEDKERLDLWGPYLIASLAILSFFYQSEFQQLVTILVGYTV
jgi:hypothetical protein